MRAHSNEPLQLYQSWDLTKPKSSPRSKLYRLQPIGVGTPRTESLASYIERLAASHRVSTRSLFTRVIGPASKKAYIASRYQPSHNWNSFVPATRALNGIGKIAYDSVSVLEKLTVQPLRDLTMLRWRYVLSEKALSRANHAWCPRCYEEMRQSNQIIYNYLFWTLVTCEVCPFHDVALETKCPHCERQLPLIDNSPGTGYCSSCCGWLGSEKKKNSYSDDASAFRLWVAHQMSEVIAAAPNMSSDPPATRITGFVPHEIDRTCNGNVNQFAQLVNVKNMTVYSWGYDRAVPQNDLILRVCFAIGQSYVELLTRGTRSPASELTNQHNSQTLLIPGFRRHTSGEVKRALIAALTVDPPVSFREVSDSLGYKSDFLSVRYPDLRKKIVQRYRTYSRRLAPVEIPEPDDEAVESALRKALDDQLPPSIQQIGKELGYAKRDTARKRIKKKFPDLHKAVAERRKIYLSNRRENIRRELHRVLLLQRPLTLDEAIELLGFKDSNYLRKYYPELCRSIVQRSQKHRRTQADLIRNKLRAMLHENPPVSLRAAAARLGKNASFLGTRFPEEGKALSKRYRLFVSKRSRARKKQGASKIRATAFELHAKGIYPSAKTIVRVLKGPQALNPTEIGEVLRKVRRNLKLNSP